MKRTANITCLDITSPAVLSATKYSARISEYFGVIAIAFPFLIGNYGSLKQ